MRCKILELLSEKQGDFLSGEALSKILQISRTAVWKQIKHLQKEGYEIIASPRRGYSLVGRPDVLSDAEIRSGLKTKVFGQKVAFFPSLVSTNETAKKMAVAGAPEGTLIIAEQQFKGKGRIGRSWFSPPAVGLWFSLILRPDILPTQAAQLTFVSAVAVCKALRAVTGLELTLKWPNDILYRDKKICGILTELSAEIEKINYLVIGIGINVRQKKDEIPPELQETAGSLAIVSGRSFQRAEMLQKILVSFEEIYDAYRQQGFGYILQAWRKLNSTLGQEVMVQSGESSYLGLAEDIDEQGRLLVRKADGKLETLMVGDVSLRRGGKEK